MDKSRVCFVLLIFNVLRDFVAWSALGASPLFLALPPWSSVDAHMVKVMFFSGCPWAQQPAVPAP